MWWEDEEEDVRSYWTTLRKREGTENLKRKYQITLCGEPFWERLWTCRKADSKTNE